jgi:hypothetical protein
MDNLQVFLLWPEENHAKKIYRENEICMSYGTPKEMHEMNAKTLMTFSYDPTHTKTRD